jgi:hypothetical protein
MPASVPSKLCWSVTVDEAESCPEIQNDQGTWSDTPNAVWLAPLPVSAAHMVRFAPTFAVSRCSSLTSTRVTKANSWLLGHREGFGDRQLLEAVTQGFGSHPQLTSPSGDGLRLSLVGHVSSRWQPQLAATYPHSSRGSTSSLSDLLGWQSVTEQFVFPLRPTRVKPRWSSASFAM